MKDKKILVLENGRGSSKELRLREEAEKRGLKLDILDCRPLILSADIKDIIPNINDYLFVFSLSNQTYCNYIMNSVNLREVNCWPNNSFLKLNDKFLQAQFLSDINVKTPKTILVNTLNREKVEKLVEDFFGGFPCIIKKVTGTFGLNVAKVNSFFEIEEFIKSRIEHSRLTGKSSFLLQEFIKEACGEDYRVLIVNGEVIGGIKRKTSDSSDFRANISLGGIASKFDIPDKVKEMCNKIYKNTKGFYLGIDLIRKDNEWNVIEINSCPQFKGFEAETGINVAEKIIKEIIGE